MLNKSPELKAQRGYVEKDSFVRLDGSEVLVGKDWKKRKIELGERCSWRCEWPSRNEDDSLVLFCPNGYMDAHHIKPRSKGRDDRLNNLQALCRYHHNLQDQRKIGGRK